jgi:metal binding Ada-like protein
MFVLTDADGRPFVSPTPGQFGGQERGKLFGRLDCPAALRAIARGGYVTQRVFFADQQTAIAAGYRPCAVCLPEQYAAWKAAISQSVDRGRLPVENLNDRSGKP